MKKTNVLLTTFDVHHPNHYFSLALGYLKAYALKDKVIRENANLEIVDFCADCNRIEQVLFYLSSIRPDIVAFACYCWNAGMIFDLSRLTKQVLPEIKIILGGPEVGPIAEKVLKENPAADVVVRGEGEETFSELLKHYINRKKDLKDIQGISYRQNDTIHSNPDRPLLESLDDIPSPYLSGVLQPRDQVTYLETYRGCPYRCAYCYEGKGYSKLRYYSAERIKQEIDMIMNHAAVTSFSFVDPVFNLNRKKTQELCHSLSAANNRGIRLHTIEIASELMDEETIKDFKRANVASVETGPQSVNKETLTNVKRHFVEDKFARGVGMCVENGIKVLCDLMIGLPGDNFFRFVRSIDFVLSLKPATIIFSTLNVLPGTYLSQHSQRFNLEFDEKPPHLVLSNSTFSYAEIRKAETLAISLGKEYNTAL